ncbi:hypothetical protein HK102_006836 [Quaeritorhiza haematococci]|nr:hypothetical protein HK102_006836 [Quaeritorhiza haematococci]
MTFINNYIFIIGGRISIFNEEDAISGRNNGALQEAREDLDNSTGSLTTANGTIIAAGDPSSPGVPTPTGTDATLATATATPFTSTALTLTPSTQIGNPAAPGTIPGARLDGLAPGNVLLLNAAETFQWVVSPDIKPIPQVSRIFGHTAFALDSSRIMVLFGIARATPAKVFRNTASVFDNSTLRWSTFETIGAIPPRRHHHVSCFNATASRVFVFGGVTENNNGTGRDLNMYILDISRNPSAPATTGFPVPAPGVGSSTVSVSNTSPSPSASPSATILPPFNAGTNFPQQPPTLPSIGTWSVIPPPPPSEQSRLLQSGNVGSAAVLVDNWLVICFGTDGVTLVPTNLCSLFDTVTMTYVQPQYPQTTPHAPTTTGTAASPSQTPPPPSQSHHLLPPPREGVSMVYLPETKEILVFGGIDRSRNVYLSDVWAMDASSLPNIVWSLKIDGKSVDAGVVSIGAVTPRGLYGSARLFPGRKVVVWGGLLSGRDAGTNNTNTNTNGATATINTTTIVGENMTATIQASNPTSLVSRDANWQWLVDWEPKDDKPPPPSGPNTLLISGVVGGVAVVCLAGVAGMMAVRVMRRRDTNGAIVLEDEGGDDGGEGGSVVTGGGAVSRASGVSRRKNGPSGGGLRFLVPITGGTKRIYGDTRKRRSSQASDAMMMATFNRRSVSSRSTLSSHSPSFSSGFGGEIGTGVGMTRGDTGKRGMREEAVSVTEGSNVVLPSSQALDCDSNNDDDAPPQLIPLTPSATTTAANTATETLPTNSTINDNSPSSSSPTPSPPAPASAPVRRNSRHTYSGGSMTFYPSSSTGANVSNNNNSTVIHHNQHKRLSTSSITSSMSSASSAYSYPSFPRGPVPEYSAWSTPGATASSSSHPPPPSTPAIHNATSANITSAPHHTFSPTFSSSLSRRDSAGSGYYSGTGSVVSDAQYMHEAQGSSSQAGLQATSSRASSGYGSAAASILGSSVPSSVAGSMMMDEEDSGINMTIGGASAVSAGGGVVYLDYDGSTSQGVGGAHDNMLEGGQDAVQEQYMIIHHQPVGGGVQGAAEEEEDPGFFEEEDEDLDEDVAVDVDAAEESATEAGTTQSPTSLDVSVAKLLERCFDNKERGL